MRQKNAVATSPLGSRCPEFDDTAESENACNKYRHEKVCVYMCDSNRSNLITCTNHHTVATYDFAGGSDANGTIY